MESRVSVTMQIDDIGAAAQELLDKALAGFSPKANTVGVLFCYSDMEVRELAAALREKAGFDIIGCTGIASMDEKEGFHSMAATLLVLTADDCTFATAVSGAITAANVDEEIGATYAAAKAALGEEPKLLFALPPYQLEIMLDSYSMGFNRVAPGVPVVGGLPSYNGSGDENLTCLNGECWGDRLVLLAMGGNVRPVFTVQNVASSEASRKRRVTKARDNVVYEVGGQRFTDYLRDIGLPVEELTGGNTTITFVSNPLILEGGSKEFCFARTLHEIDLEAGTGTAIGQIPQEATLSVCTLQRSEIEEAALAGIRDLKDKMEGQEGYQFTTVLAVSCIGRHLLMLPDNDAEVKQLLREFPKGMTLAGFYSYGEIGPQGEAQTRNFAHNESLVLCAF